jgi:hypothetical protein
VINPSQRPLPDNTQHPQQTNIHAPGGIRTHDLSRRAAEDPRLRARERPKTHALERAATGTGKNILLEGCSLTDTWFIPEGQSASLRTVLCVTLEMSICLRSQYCWHKITSDSTGVHEINLNFRSRFQVNDIFNLVEMSVFRFKIPLPLRHPL